MKITVAICTWNRAKLLDLTLERMRQMRIPDGVEWELLVVNNNCTDGTDAVLERHAAYLPLRRLLETKQGVSHSRNCAVASARGELILWTDDDVMVDSGWLAEYVAAAQRWTDAAFFGGPIQPWFEVDPPPWVRENLHLLQNLLVIRDFGERERYLDASEIPYGANMAFRAELLKKHSFDPRYGYSGDDKICGDENTVFSPILSGGGRGVWIPKARVRHYVPASRMSRHYLRQYGRGCALTAYREGKPQFQPVGNERRIGGVPIWFYRRWLMFWFTAQVRRIRGHNNWFESYISCYYLKTIILENHSAWSASRKRQPEA